MRQCDEHYVRDGKLYRCLNAVENLEEAAFPKDRPVMCRECTEKWQRRAFAEQDKARELQEAIDAKNPTKRLSRPEMNKEVYADTMRGSRGRLLR